MILIIFNSNKLPFFTLRYYCIFVCIAIVLECYIHKLVLTDLWSNFAHKYFSNCLLSDLLVVAGHSY